MDTKDKQSLTINALNIVGKKVDVDINILKKYPNLKEIIIKNIEIDNKIIELLNNLKLLEKVFLVNCEINTKIQLNQITKMELAYCKNVKGNILCNNLSRLYIDNCVEVDINDFMQLKLESLAITNTIIRNLNYIENIQSVRNLYLNEVDLNQEIDFNKLNNLEKLDLDGSKVQNKEEFFNQIKNKSIKVTFKENYRRIG